MSILDKFINNIKIINSFEKDHKYENLEYKNINIIPLIRLILFRNEELNYKNNFIQRSFIISKLKSILKIPYFVFKKFRYSKYLKKIKNKKIDLVFFSDSAFYYDKIKGKKVNLFIDPYFELLKKKYKSIKVEIISHNFYKNEVKRNEPFYLNLFYINFFYYMYNSFKKVFTKQKKFKFKKKFKSKYESIYNIDKGNQIGLLIDKILFESNSFELFLKQINPKIVFLTCYYSHQNLPIIHACKKLNIPSVDIQHGGQEEYNPMYSNWLNREIKSFKLLPDYLWVWGKNQKNEGIFNNKYSKHNYVVGGKAQLDFYQKYRNFFDSNYSNQQKKFLQKKKNYKKVILFGATFSKIPQIIIDLIKTGPKNWLWLIRAHPRHSNLKDIEMQFKRNKIHNVEIKVSTFSNLYFVLNNSTHMIVEYSSIVYDALYFNLPSIILQKNNFYFKKTLKNKNLIFSLNKKKIINFINKKSSNRNFDKICDSKNLISKVITKILGN